MVTGGRALQVKILQGKRCVGFVSSLSVQVEKHAVKFEDYNLEDPEDLMQ